MSIPTAIPSTVRKAALPPTAPVITSDAVDRTRVRRALPIAGTRRGWATSAALTISDILALVAPLALVRVATNLVVAAPALNVSPDQLRLGILLVGTTVAVALLHGLYSPLLQSSAAELRKTVTVVSLVTLGIVGAMALMGHFTTADIAWIGISGALATLLVPVYRLLVRGACGSLRWWGTRVVIVGGGSLALATLDRLARKPHLGYRPVGVVDDSDPAAGSPPADGWLGPIEELGQITARYDVGCAVVAMHSFDAEEMARLVATPKNGVVRWLILPASNHLPSLATEVRDVAGQPALATTNYLAITNARRMKRAFDLAVTLTLGALALPLCAVLALLVRLSSPGPIFYSQERIGLHGRRFRAWKFRSMFQNADAVLEHYLETHPELRAEWDATHKLKNDPRVTWIGRILRRTSLDELPQVWNVIRGEMSLVGPRPIVEAEIDRYAENYERYVQVTPGISGLWQISGRNNTTYAERVDYDVTYVNNWSPWFDLYILVCTVKVVLFGEGAY